MCKFALEKNSLGKGPIAVYNLLIKGEDQFLLFRKKFSTKQYIKELKNITVKITLLSDGMQLTKGSIKKINEIPGGFEFRTRSLRLYYIQIQSDDNIVICLGGLKKDQKKEIKRFKKLAEEAQRIYNYEK